MFIVLLLKSIYANDEHMHTIHIISINLIFSEGSWMCFDLIEFHFRMCIDGYGQMNFSFIGFWSSHKILSIFYSFFRSKENGLVTFGNVKFKWMTSHKYLFHRINLVNQVQFDIIKLFLLELMKVILELETNWIEFQDCGLSFPSQSCSNKRKVD